MWIGGQPGFIRRAVAADDGINDFSGDANCVSLWRLESGAIATDSKGTVTWTLPGSPYNPSSNTSDKREGGASADFEANTPSFLYELDGDLPSGFPFKSGGSQKTFSVCAWIKMESLPASSGSRAWFAKFDANSTTGQSIGLYFYNNGSITYASGVVRSTGAEEYVNHASSLSAGTWYHLTFTYNDSTKGWTYRIRDTSGNAVGSDASGTLTYNIQVSNGPLFLGAMANGGSVILPFDGLIDEVVLFKDVLTEEESTKIAEGLYP